MKSLLENIFPTLTKKIAVAVVLVFLGTGSTFVFFAYRTGYKMLEKQAQAKAHGVAKLEGAILEHLMLEGKNDRVQTALKLAVSSRQASDLLILKQDGTVALSARGDRLSEKFPLKQFRQLPEWHGDRFLTVRENGSLYEYIAVPIVKKPECYRCHQEPEAIQGYFVVKVTMDDLRAIATEHRTVNILMTVLTFGGLGCVTFLALLFLVIRPIGTLRTHIRRIEDGIGKLESGEQTRFPLLHVSERNDEIADLSRAFNNLISRLNEANAKLYELHQVQLEQADHLATTGEMAASIAHEIRNPLAGVLGALQVFDSEIQEDDPHKEILAEMMTQLERMNHAVNDLLSYARPSPPVFEEVAINDVIEKTLALLSQQVKETEITIESFLLSDHVVILADRKLFQQVLWNVMLNALQAMETSGTLSVKTMQEDSFLKIQIMDTGNGIPPENLERIFKPFFTTKHKGTGLGLAISRRIIEQHHGTIALVSEVGKGTMVTISVPVSHQKV